MTIECCFLSRLSSDAEQKQSKAGKTYLKLSFRMGDGDGAERINVISFDQKALQDSDKFVRGAAVYVEGKLSINRWKGLDGGDRSAISVMSFHSRLSQIGSNKTKRDKRDDASVAGGYVAPRSAPAGRLPGGGQFDDEIPFAPEVR